MSKKAKPKKSKKLTPEERLWEIADIIENVDERCAAHDGPVGNTRDEMTDTEMRRIYRLATKGAT